MPKIQVAYVHPNTVGHNFMHSMMGLDMTDLMPTHASARASAMGLVDARNQLTEYFLDKTDADYLWWIDSDMGFTRNTPQLLAKHGVDAVGARTYGLGPVSHDGLGGFVTKQYLVAYDMYQQEDGFTHFALIEDPTMDKFKNEAVTDKDKATPDTTPLVDEDEDDSEVKLLKVAATGTGCFLVSRNALLKVRAEFGDTWFNLISYPQRGEQKPMTVSEDISFCYRLGCVGVEIFIDLNIKTNHMKTVWIS